MSDFSGTYFFNEFLRLLHMRNFLTGRIHYPRHYCIAFIRQNRSRAEVTLVKIGRLLHKFSAQMPIFGRIRSTTAKLAPVLGNMGCEPEPAILWLEKPSTLLHPIAVALVVGTYV